VRDKLRELNFRLTELATYLSMSRPTLYKYIDSFEQKQYKDIDANTLDTFKYINSKNTISKLQIIDFIIQHKNQEYKLNTLLVDKIRELIDTEDKEKMLFDLLEIFKSNDIHSRYEVIKKYIKGEKEND
jgi:hypothetical protein